MPLEGYEEPFSFIFGFLNSAIGIIGTAFCNTIERELSKREHWKGGTSLRSIILFSFSLLYTLFCNYRTKNANCASQRKPHDFSVTGFSSSGAASTSC
jgi:hypothetical protein